MAKMKEPGRWGVFSGEITCFISGYDAPEVAARPIMYSLFDNRVDIWRLGVLMYDLISLKRCVWTRKAEDMVYYSEMGLYPDVMRKRMQKVKAPHSVMELVLWVSAWFVLRFGLLIIGMQMCQMVAPNRPSALNILDEVKKWNRWPHS